MKKIIKNLWKSEKCGLSIGMRKKAVVLFLCSGILAGAFSGCSDGGTKMAAVKFPENIGDAKKISKTVDLEIDGSFPANLSPSGKYLLTNKQDDKFSSLTLYEWNTEKREYEEVREIDLQPALADILNQGINKYFTQYGEEIEWSPDEKYFVFGYAESLFLAQDSDIFICEVETGKVTNISQSDEEANEQGDEGKPRMLSENFCIDVSPQWSADGKTIYYYSYGENTGIYRVSPQGGSSELFIEMDKHSFVSEIAVTKDKIYYVTPSDEKLAMKLWQSDFKGNAEVLFDPSEDSQEELDVRMLGKPVGDNILLVVLPRSPESQERAKFGIYNTKSDGFTEYELNLDAS